MRPNLKQRYPPDQEKYTHNFLKDENGELVCENQFVTFVRNQGGFGGTNEAKTIVQPIDAPDREPDHVTEEFVPEGQAALYRLK